MALLVTNIPWNEEGRDPRAALAERLGVPNDSILDYLLLKRSVDGRRRPPQWLANYRVALSEPALEDDVLGRAPHGVRRFNLRDEARYESEGVVAPARAGWPAGVRPIVIGAGPAGLFAALRLGEAGAPAILLERGGPVAGGAGRRVWRGAGTGECR